MKNKIKTSEKQQKVLDLLKEGWEMAETLSWKPDNPPHIRLQQDGLGNGGKVYRTDARTLNSLLARKVVKYKKENHCVKDKKLILA